MYQKSQSYDNVQFLRYGVRQTEFFFIFGHFLLFYHPSPLNDLENQNFEKKWKKCPDILSFYTYMCAINEDHRIYGSWNIRCDRQKFLLFRAIFCLFSPLTTWKIKILNLKKLSGDIIILHICTINDNYMMYGSWDMESDGQKFLSFWTVSYPFTPLTTRKTKFWKNEKNTWRYHHFTYVYQKYIHSGTFFPFYPTSPIKILKKIKETSEDIILQMWTINDSHMMYGFWDMECNGQNVLSFWAGFCPFTPLTTQKIKTLKK